MAEVTKPMSTGEGAPAPAQGATGTPAAPTGPAPEAPGVKSFLLPVLLMFGLMWLLVMRPERKRQKELEKLRGAVKKGDRVLLTAGMTGTVAAVADDWVTVEVADKVRIQFQKSAVAQVLDTKEKPEAAAAE